MSIWSISNAWRLNTSWWTKILMDYSLLIDDYILIHDWHNKFWRNTNCCSRSTNASRWLITNGWVNTMTNWLNTNWWLSTTRCSRSITGKGVPTCVLRPWLITNLMTKHELNTNCCSCAFAQHHWQGRANVRRRRAVWGRASRRTHASKGE